MVVSVGPPTPFFLVSSRFLYFNFEKKEVYRQGAANSAFCSSVNYFNGASAAAAVAFNSFFAATRCDHAINWHSSYVWRWCPHWSGLKYVSRRHSSNGINKWAQLSRKASGIRCFFSNAKSWSFFGIAAGEWWCSPPPIFVLFMFESIDGNKDLS